MKAIVHTTYGAPDILQLTEVPTPTPAENEVRIKIHASTVETTDTIFRGGKTLSARMFTGPMKPKFTIPGGGIRRRNRRRWHVRDALQGRRSGVWLVR